ncbi:DUF4258 domain-containing protein [Flavobacteriaceae bacterium F89]|uniref:DUF4258 domain-containing protein n=1 Tax=Cerina litoralis TaxID=2874477 RepID=A0AAE3JTA9_9FLAO|nr:DUF4258 domain-containing protein [Cerina litoralis]MCG2461342.1 DUF4258 domain-containing protein [Cerina litoralis]
MPLLKRFGLFFIGLSMGLVFLTFFYKNKTRGTDAGFCYLPNCRVLKNIRSKPVTYSDKVDRLLEEKRLDSVDIKYFLYQGDVDFDKSETESEPCKIYVIQGLIGEKEAVAHIRNCEDNAVVEDIVF